MDFTAEIKVGELKQDYSLNDLIELVYSMMHRECGGGKIIHKLAESEGWWILTCQKCGTSRAIKLFKSSDEKERVALASFLSDINQKELALGPNYSETSVVRLVKKE